MARNLVTLAECPPGLFLFEGALGFKTEYGMTIGTDVTGWPDAYCVESGECFWGGTSTHADRASLVVEPMKGADVLFVRWSDNDQHIRRWSRKPFDEGAPIAAVEQDYPVTEERVGSLRDVPSALADIDAERQRQIAEEGYTPAHDDGHANDHALPRAAACLALAGTGGGNGPFWITHLQTPQQVWPYRWEWKPKDRRHNLVRAAALLVAEIERLDRAEGRA